VCSPVALRHWLGHHEHASSPNRRCGAGYPADATSGRDSRPGAVVLSKARLKATGLVVVLGNHTRLRRRVAPETKGRDVNDQEQPSIKAYDSAAWRSAPTGTNKPRERMPWLGLAGIIALLMVVFGGLAHMGNQRYLKLSGAPDPAVETEGREYIANLLRDPSSAQFRNTAVQGECLDGEVNGKNAFGGYAGFTKFFYNRKTGVGRTEPDVDGLLKVLDPKENLVAQMQFEFAHSDCLSSAINTNNPG
jgi:hypothetical protein